jgi:hypothetical protein
MWGGGSSLIHIENTMTSAQLVTVLYEAQYRDHMTIQCISSEYDGLLTLTLVSRHPHARNNAVRREILIDKATMTPVFDSGPCGSFTETSNKCLQYDDARRRCPACGQ